MSILVAFLLVTFALLWFVRYLREQEATNSNQSKTAAVRLNNFSLKSSQAIKVDSKRPTTRFEDVAGCEESVEELRVIVEFLRDSRDFAAMGGRIHKGVLLHGDPGTGKTLLARAVAGESDVAFLPICGSEFVEMFVGVGARRVRDLFNEARKKGKAIIYIDEIDAVGRHRGAGISTNDERESTLNQLLVEMDGFKPDEQIVVMASTNRPDLLDNALTRPGRLGDLKVKISRPDLRGRIQIFTVHARKKPLAPEVDLNLLARKTTGFTGADIASVLNQAAILAAIRIIKCRRDLRQNGASEQIISQIPRLITPADLDEAVLRVQHGTALISRACAMSEEQKKQTAFHEAGHAVVARAKGGDPVTMLTIIPRGDSLGTTAISPDEDRMNWTQRQLLVHIMTLMGGRLAQEIFLQTVDTGASDDFDRACELARQMVIKFGMSKLGPVNINTGDNGRPATQLGYSLQDEIDREWRRIISECTVVARAAIEANRERTERIVEQLLEQETLAGHDFERLWNATDVAAPGDLNLSTTEPAVKK